MKKKAIIVSGYFNPLHKGHLEYFSLAKKNGDILVVIINNDIQRAKKGSKEFMLEDERELIISNLKIRLMLPNLFFGAECQSSSHLCFSTAFSGFVTLPSPSFRPPSHCF